MKISRRLYFTLPVVFFMACNYGHKDPEKDTEGKDLITKQIDSSKIMHNDMPNKAKTGVGPIKNKVELGMKIDETMAAKGEKLFNNKCATCHEIHDSNVGPALGGVLEKHSPQWVMNMILNPDGMIENDVQVKALKAVYETRMVDLNLSEEEARQIVEYLRKY